MTNSIKNRISLNLQEGEKSEKISRNDLTSFLCFLLALFSSKNSWLGIKKLVKTLLQFFRKFAILTENPINFDIPCSVILGTVQWVQIIVKKSDLMVSFGFLGHRGWI